MDISLNAAWKTVANDTNPEAFYGFENSEFNDVDWEVVDLPHNWDTYHGYLRKVHGNRHGYAWYRKEFAVQKLDVSERCFLWFEGVGSYATVWVNGKKAGQHAGGRTSFTLDITELVAFDKPNILSVQADHPANIRNLPWVCGGCSDEWGFSEGSQPMGIFRPVHLIVTSDVRIEPFGVHLWNDATVTDQYAKVFHATEIRNYSKQPRRIRLVSTLYNQDGKKVTQTSSEHSLGANETVKTQTNLLEIENPSLWSPHNPYLYTLHSEIWEEGKLIDKIKTNYGIRWISWPANRNDSTGQFLINGEPFFINGIGEYEHQFGKSHAFTDEQIHTRVMQIKAAGFNAFRDAHQPHNLKYQQYWDELGMLWWTQMAAHIWFDNPAFKENFKNLLKDWVKERRNSPSVILWGLENESTLPTEFAEECTAIIRELDPTTSSQRLVTTCNGGTGTDWNVVQNWSGTYSGNPEKYSEELSEQLLNGEYGAWRSLDFHTEGVFNQKGPLSEDRMAQLMESKIRLAEEVSDKSCGQFLWLLNSHDNPGRFQNGEGLREIDRIGPVNYKGLLTPWGEPVDAFYLYRANYVSSEEEPMVYIVSHTWPSRWTKPGMKDRIVVYSNCDEVEIFNDYNSQSLGKIKRSGKGQPFIWNKPSINYNILQAIGYLDGEKVAEDLIVLNHLPEAPHFAKLKMTESSIAKGNDAFNYIYRVNCGGNNYRDENGNLWLADRHLTSDSSWGSISWTDDFTCLPDFYASQRRTFDPISGTNDWKLLQTFRYGREKLSFRFPLPDGNYQLEMYFTEPWYGTGGGMNCEAWRQFDVAVNGETILKDFDIWKESGHDHALKKVFQVESKGGYLNIHFPRIISGQAIISAIAIASNDDSIIPAPPSQTNIHSLKKSSDLQEDQWTIQSWLDLGDFQYAKSQIRFSELPPALFGAEWIRTPLEIDMEPEQLLSFKTRKPSDIFVAINSSINIIPEWLKSYTRSPLVLANDDDSQPDFGLYSKRIPANDVITIGGMDTEVPGAPIYSVFVVPVSSLNASSDQRKVKKYDSEVATLSGSGLKRRTDGDRGFIELTNQSKNNIGWEFYVGMASEYEVALKFNNTTISSIPAELKIYTANGILMHAENLEFAPTADRWRTIKTKTGSAINAGTYTITISIEGHEGLRVDYLTIQ